MKKGFGAELARLMAEKGVESQSALARAAGIHRPVVTRLLNDERLGITAETLFGLARALGVTCAHFEPWLDLPAADPPQAAGGDEPKPRKPPPKSPETGAGQSDAPAKTRRRGS